MQSALPHPFSPGWYHVCRAAFWALAVTVAAAPALATPVVLQLDDGVSLLAEPTEDPFAWRTAFGFLEIPTDRIAWRDGQRVAGPLGQAPAYRFRLLDGTLHVGVPTRVTTTQVMLLEPGGRRTLLELAQVMEVNDLARWGPGAQVSTLPNAPASPLPLPLPAPTRLGRPSLGGDAPPRPAPPPRSEALTRPLAQRPSSLSVGVRLGQVSLGVCGLGAGGGLGALAFGEATDSALGMALGAGLAGTLGAAAVIYGVGEANGGGGSFTGTLVGTGFGVVAGLVVFAAVEEDGFPLALLLPLAGGTFGYAISEPDDRT